MPAEEHGMNLELKLTATIGFVLVLRADKRGYNDLRHLALPDEFVNIVRKPAQVTCMTLDLVGACDGPFLLGALTALTSAQIKLNDRMNEALQEVYLMSNRSVRECSGKYYGRH
jgi:hypothetical protein